MGWPETYDQLDHSRTPEEEEREQELMRAPKRKNPNSETSILAPLIEFLEICSNQGRLRYFRAHPVRLISRNGQRFPGKIRPSQRGAPDIFVWLGSTEDNLLNHETNCWIEGKSGKGKASKDQETWKQMAEYVGIPYFQPRSHGDVSQIINWIRERI